MSAINNRFIYSRFIAIFACTHTILERSKRLKGHNFVGFERDEMKRTNGNGRDHIPDYHTTRRGGIRN